MPPHYTPFLAASGLVPPTLHESEEPSAILDSIENLAFSFLNDLIKGHVNGNFGRINRTITNAEEQLYTGAIVLGSKITKHRFNARNVVSIARMFQVISFVQTLLLRGSRVCQRELFYVLIHSFQCQRQLNATVQDVSATLAVPRYALNIGASTRGVIAGSLRVALCGSPYQVDCQYVGSVSSLTIFIVL